MTFVAVGVGVSPRSSVAWEPSSAASDCEGVNVPVLLAVSVTGNFTPPLGKPEKLPNPKPTGFPRFPVVSVFGAGDEVDVLSLSVLLDGLEVKAANPGVNGVDELGLKLKLKPLDVSEELAVASGICGDLPKNDEGFESDEVEPNVNIV